MTTNPAAKFAIILTDTGVGPLYMRPIMRTGDDSTTFMANERTEDRLTWALAQANTIRRSTSRHRNTVRVVEVRA